MGAATHSFPPGRSLTDKERTAAVRTALSDGTVTRVLTLVGWSPTDLAERVHTLPSVVEQWLTGDEVPSWHEAAKLWTVLVCALRYQDAPPPDGPRIRLR